MTFNFKDLKSFESEKVFKFQTNVVFLSWWFCYKNVPILYKSMIFLETYFEKMQRLENKHVCWIIIVSVKHNFHYCIADTLFSRNLLF